MGAKVLRTFYVLAFILIVAASIIGCSSKTTVYVPYIPPQTTTVYVPQTTTYSPPQITTNIPQNTTTKSDGQNGGQSTWDWQPTPGNLITAGNAAYLPGDGAYIRSGTTLTLSWSAEGSMDAFIMTANQFSNMRGNLNIPSAWLTRNSGSSGSLSVKIQNSDSYFGVIKNNAVPSFGPSVKLYQATLTSR